MPTGVYERNPKLIDQITKRLREWREMHENALKGTRMPRAVVEKQRAGRLRYYENHTTPNKDIPHSETTREKISRSMKEYWHSSSNNSSQRRQERSETMRQYWEWWWKRKKKQHHPE
jgi:hypothetical protein